MNQNLKMSESDAGEVEFSLKVMMNENKTKVLFAVADRPFVDILFSFLTLPLGRIVKVLDKHYGDEAPTIGSLSSLYRSLANLDSAHFWTEGAKEALVDPRSSFDAEYKTLKLDISGSPPPEYFYCSRISCHNIFRSVSLYYDNVNDKKNFCGICYHSNVMRKEVVPRGSESGSSEGVLTIQKASFTISDDLQIFPNEMGLLQIIAILGITDAHRAEEIQVEFGLSEIVKLLNASLTSPTPLSDVVLNKTTKMEYSAIMDPRPNIEKVENHSSKYVSLKVMIQKSSGKLLYAQAKQDFVEFLFGFLLIPLGGAVHLLGGKSLCKPINNLYQSTDNLELDYFKSQHTKNRLIKPNLPHGCISKDYILPLSEEPLPPHYIKYLGHFSSSKFPKGEGRYLLGPQTYKVTDDLTVEPFCAVSILSTLNKLGVPISDVEEVELQIGLNEGLRILKASLTSTSALFDALLDPTSMKNPKREP